MNRLLDDLRGARRSLVRHPMFVAVAACTLALGIGASTTMFGVVDAILLRPLPYPGSERLVLLGATLGEMSVSALPWAVVRELDKEPVFEEVAASRELSPVWHRGGHRDGEPLRIESAAVSQGFFSMLGCIPTHGRGFAPADDQPNAEPVALLSDAFWQRHWNGDPSVVGTSIRLGERHHTVIGVLPRGFQPPEALFDLAPIDLWVPLGTSGRDLEDPENFELEVLAKVVMGSSEETIQMASDRALGRFAEANPEAAQWSGKPIGLWSAGLKERTVGGIGRTLGIFLGAVGLLLLIACSNVANLFLARGTERRRELALRTALGADRRRLLRLLLIESVLIALGGGVLGAGLAFAGTRVVVALSPGTIPRLAEIAVDLRVLGFTLGLSLVTGLLFGLVPALSATLSLPVRRALVDGATSTVGRRAGFLRSGLVVVQIALALVLTIGAGLLLNSLLRILRADPGFDPHHLYEMTVRIEDQDEARQRAFFTELEQHVAAIPGARSAGMAFSMPVSRSGMWSHLMVEGAAPDAQSPFIRYNVMSPALVQTLGIRLLDGRLFDHRDRDGQTEVAVINQRLARQLWGDASPLGRRFKQGNVDSPEHPWLTVVGVVDDLRQRALHREAEAEFFRPFAQAPMSRMRLVARIPLGGQAAGQAMRQALRAVDPLRVEEGFRGLERAVTASMAEPRFYAALLSGFAGIALLLAAVGVFGSMSFRVARRLREMGIRMALGASSHQVVGMVVRQGLRVAMLGLLMGLASTLFLARFLSHFVFGITPHDPLTYIGVSALLLGVAVLACYLPARQAARIDPVRVLRNE